MYFIVLVIFVFGLIIGSFLSALTYRLNKGVKISKGRSKCPKCNQKISWYDNIPLLSFILLRGKCRNCKKKISIRYPLIELATGLLFVAGYYRNIYFYNEFLSSSSASFLCSLLLILFVIAVSVAIFITDFEEQNIPDVLVFTGLLVVFATYLFTNIPLYSYLLSAFVSASFFLFLNLITKGKGMGLGDAKLSLLYGLFLGPKLTWYWLLLSFILGGIVATILLFMKKAKFGQHIAFGPFLVVAFLLIIFGITPLKQFIMPLF